MITLCVLGQFTFPLGKFQPQPHRCIRMRAGISQLQREFPNHMVSEIQPDDRTGTITLAAKIYGCVHAAAINHPAI